MVEISSSGSGEGPGWATSRPTLQRHFRAAPPAAPAPACPAAPTRRCGLQPGGARGRTVWTGPAAGGGQIAKGILHALQAAVQIGVHEGPEEPRAWASTDAGTTEKKWPGQARPRVTVETGDLPACPEFVRACSTASVCD